MTEDNVTYISEEEISEAAKRDNITPMRTIDLNQYPSLTLNQMLADPPEPLEHVLFPVLPVKGIGWIYAPSGVGKTLFTLNVAYAIASGGEFLKYRCPKPRKVLYVDGEMQYSIMYERLQDIRKEKGDLDFDDNLHLWTQDKMPIEIPKMDDIIGQEIYKKKLLDEGFEVVVFDNLSILSCVDTNKSRELKPILHWLVRLRHAGITVLVVHHSGKNGEYRGSSEMIDAADVAIQLVGLEDESDETVRTVKKINISYKKTRGFGGVDAIPYEVQLINGKWSYESLQKTNLNRIVDMVLMKMTYRDIAGELKLSLSKVCREVRRAREKGMLPLSP